MRLAIVAAACSGNSTERNARLTSGIRKTNRTLSVDERKRDGRPQDVERLATNRPSGARPIEPVHGERDDPAARVDDEERFGHRTICRHHTAQSSPNRQ